MKKRLLLCLALLSFALPFSNALATSAADLEASLVASDVATAKSQLADIRKSKSLDTDRTVGYMLLTEAYEALEQFHAAATKFAEDKQESRFAEVERTFSTLARAARPVATYRLEASKALIDTYNEKIQAANTMYAALREENRTLVQQRRELALAEEKRKQEEQRARWEKEEQERQLAIQKQNEEYQRDLAREERQRVAAQKQQRVQQAKVAGEQKALQEVCGADYKALRVGMPLFRANQCYGKFVLRSQINRADGVVSTYWHGSTYAHVMNGLIVSWGK